MSLTIQKNTTRFNYDIKLSYTHVAKEKIYTRNKEMNRDPVSTRNLEIYTNKCYTWLSTSKLLQRKRCLKVSP